IPLILLFMIWSSPLMGLFGADFRAGSPLLVILCLGQAVNCGTGSVGYLLLMSGHQKEMIRGQLIFGILLLLADWSLIPVAGVRAAVPKAETTAAALTPATGIRLQSASKSNMPKINCPRIISFWWPDMSSRYPTDPVPQLTAWPRQRITRSGLPARKSAPKRPISGHDQIINRSIKGIDNPSIHFVSVSKRCPSTL